MFNQEHFILALSKNNNNNQKTLVCNITKSINDTTTKFKLK